ncbi:MAG: oxygenase MpaB family protein [Phormidesmis sp.]
MDEPQMVENKRLTSAQQIQQLDPEKDAIAICHLLAGYEFPWDITRALEIALLRTFCIPAISRLLDKTGEFRRHTQKRYDDTGIVVSELLKWGYHHPRGQAFLQRMNAIHQRYEIDNADYLYVLSTFIYEPVRWIEQFGWRQLTEREKQALYYFWREVGTRMMIVDIPPTYAAFEAYNREYEQTHFVYQAANQRVADATRQMLVGWFPWGVRSLANPTIPTLLDPALLQAVGWQPAPVRLTAWVKKCLHLRSRLLRQLPPRTLPDFFIDQAIRSYPQGYSVEEIGPSSLLDQLN